MRMESVSFDGFSVVWTPDINGQAECEVAIRFNFLSTNFRHSKGVEGMPVRLCAKTMPVLISPQAMQIEVSPEICCCKVKLFKDHGAARKHSTEIARVRKTIEKQKRSRKSSQPVSVLYLRGEDLDAHPVILPGGPLADPNSFLFDSVH